MMQMSVDRSSRPRAGSCDGTEYGPVKPELEFRVPLGPAADAGSESGLSRPGPRGQIGEST